MKHDVDQDGDLHTLVVPKSKSIINSVTSDSVCQIAKSLGWHVEIRPIPYEEIETFTEVIAVGTAAALVPIKSITMRSRFDKFLYQEGSDEPGPACVKLLSILKGIQQGKIKDAFGWLDVVEEPKDFEREMTNGTNGIPNGHHVPNGIVNKLP